MIVDGMIWILVVEEAKYNTEEAKNNVKLIFLCVGGRSGRSVSQQHHRHQKQKRKRET